MNCSGEQLYGQPFRILAVSKISDESAPQPNLLKSRAMGTLLLLGMLGVNNTDI